MNKNVMNEYKKKMKEAMKLDPDFRKYRIKEIKKWFKTIKGINWHKMIEENVNNSQ